MRRIFVLCSAVVLACAACGPSATKGDLFAQSNRTGTQHEGAIAFARSGPRGGIYVLKPHHDNPTRLTTITGDTDPAWSPDGTRIAFVRFDRGNADVYVIGPDGSGLARLTTDGVNSNPTWSPDGSKIAFAREADGNSDIYIMDADGGQVIRLTNDPLREYSPDWSPDGTRLAFVGFTVGEPASPVRLFVMNADGSERKQLGPPNVAQPEWSRDGTRIAFVEADSGSISVVNHDGSGLRQVVDFEELTSARGNLTMSPSWSLDDSKLTFATGKDAVSTHIYVVDADGSNLEQLTNEPTVSDAVPDWAPVMDVPQEVPECPRVGEGGYALQFSTDTGPPGTAVTVSGATPVYAEDGTYVGPDGEIQFWWNADPDYWHDALPGPPEPAPKNPSATVVSLGAIELTDCQFQFEFEIPDVASGDYPILPLAVVFKDSGVWDSATFHAAYAPVFRVTENH